MSHCLKKMFEATAGKKYDFWYYQSLLEEPYTTLQEYCSKQTWLRELESSAMLMAEESVANKEFSRKNGGTKWG